MNILRKLHINHFELSHKEHSAEVLHKAYINSYMCYKNNGIRTSRLQK